MPTDMWTSLYELLVWTEAWIRSNSVSADHAELTQ